MPKYLKDAEKWAQEVLTEDFIEALLANDPKKFKIPDKKKRRMKTEEEKLSGSEDEKEEEEECDESDKELDDVDGDDGTLFNPVAELDLSDDNNGATKEDQLHLEGFADNIMLVWNHQRKKLVTSFTLVGYLLCHHPAVQKHAQENGVTQDMMQVRLFFI